MESNETGLPRIKDDYAFSKSEFVKDFIRRCRYMKKEYTHKPLYSNVYVGVCGEFWQFEIFIKDDSVFTQAKFWDKGTPILYPKTKWGEPYVRWDLDLRNFLLREVCKAS